MNSLRLTLVLFWLSVLRETLGLSQVCQKLIMQHMLHMQATDL